MSVEFLWPELGEHNIPVWGCPSPWVVCATKPRTGGVRLHLTGRSGTCSDSVSRRPFWAGRAGPWPRTAASPRMHRHPPPSPPASFPPLLTKCTSPPLSVKPQDQPYAIGLHPSLSADRGHPAGGSQHVTELAGGTPGPLSGEGRPRGQRKTTAPAASQYGRS